MKVYALERVDGGVAIMRTLGNPSAEIRRWPARRSAELTGVIHEITEDAIPKDRTFRNAWKPEVGKIVHDMSKCREMHRQKLRAIRKPKLGALDAQCMRALEAGDIAAQSEIVAQKQALRDVTADPAIDLASSPEELKAVMPEALKS